MTTVTFKGTPVHLSGTPLAVGQTLPDVILVKSDLTPTNLGSFEGKTIVLNIYPSVDTGVCFKAVQHFDEMVAKNPDMVVICISMDLPFASARVATAEKLSHVIFLSDFRDHAFGSATGLRLKDGPLAGVLARTVMIVDKHQKIQYVQLVPEITQGPDYDAVMAALKEI